MKGLLDTLLGGEGESRIDLGRDLSGNNLQDLAAELHKEVIQCGIDLIIEVLSVLPAILDSGIDELGVFGLLGRSEDQRWVGGGILRLVLGNGCKVAGVADNDLD